MTRIRRLGALTLAAPLAIGFTVLGAPGADAAALTISPSDGAVVKSSRLVVKGSVGSSSDQARLTFNGLSYEGKGGVTKSFDAHELRNGSYTAKIEKKFGLFWIENKSATFSLRTAPYSPKGLSASVSGRKLKVSWNLGPEPDLTGYDVTAGGIGTATGGDGAMCAGTQCAKTFRIPTGASGRVSVVVHARRSTGSGGTITSPASSTSVTVAGSFAPGGSGGGTTGGGGYPGGGSNTPLLPVTEDSPLSLPTVAPDGATPGFQYPTPVPEVAEQNTVAAPDARNVAAVDNIQWGKSIASALILLIVAAHLGTWTRSVRTAGGPMSGRGMAARMSRAGSGRARVRMARASIAHAEAAAKAAALMESKGKSGSGRAAKTRELRTVKAASTAKTKPAGQRTSMTGPKATTESKPAAKSKTTARSRTLARHRAKATSKTAS